MNRDDDFANAAYIPDGETYPDRWAADAAAFRDSVTAELDLPYGETPRAVFDLFHPPRLALGVVVFVHGGYWLRFDKSYWSHLAAGPLAAGWAVAMPSYDLAPDASIPQITQQIRQAIGVIADRVPGPLRLTGHSAGGHLVARMLDPALRAGWGDRVQRVVPISPVADLTPLIDTSMNDDLGLDAETARAESPVHQPAPRTPTQIWVGADERPVFIAQAQALGDAWDVPCTVAPEKHHFDVIEDLAEAQSALTQALLSD